MADKFPNPDHRGAIVNTGLRADAADYERNRQLSKASGLTQPQVHHLILEMMRVLLTTERGKGNLSVDRFPSDLEAFVWLVAVHSGLVTAQEMEAAAWTVENTSGGATFKDRIPGLFELLQKRFAERHLPYDLEDEGEAFERVDDDYPERLQAEIEAKRQEVERNKPKPDAGAAE